MNLQHITSILDLETKFDGDEIKHEAKRRGFLSQATNLSAKAILASIPAIAIAMLPKVVKANSSDAITDVLNFALTAEYLEAEFYNMGTAATNLIPTTYQTVFNTIKAHENQHVALLKVALGANAIAKPNFDFTGRKNNPNAAAPFADWNTNFTTFLALSQAFEDTGERAYKGQAPALLGTDVLTTALQIHGVEARHASAVRHIRAMYTNTTIKSWKVDAEANGLPAAIYAGEENTNQGGVELNSAAFKTIDGYTMGTTAATEAFDEPMTKDTAVSILSLFIY